MKRENGFDTRYFLVFSLLSAIAIPGVSAYTGISPLDGAMTLIATLFNLPSLQNPAIQEGFLKFMLFVVLFAISNFGLMKAFDKAGNNAQGRRAANIIAFAFSMIGIFMMPTFWLRATGGVITAIMSSFVFILIFWGGAWLAMKVLTGDKLKDLFGVSLLLFLLFLVGVWANVTNLPTGRTGNIVVDVYSVMVSWTTLIIVILLIVKLFQTVGFSFEGIKLGPGPGLGTGGSGGKGPRPGMVEGFSGSMNPNPLHVDLKWTPRPNDENIAKYEIKRRPLKGTILWGGWRNVGTVSPGQSTFRDSAEFPVRRVLRPTYWDNSAINPNLSYEYIIHAVNSQNRGGSWSKTIVNPPGPENKQHGNTAPEGSPELPETDDGQHHNANPADQHAEGQTPNAQNHQPAGSHGEANAHTGKPVVDAAAPTAHQGHGPSSGSTKVSPATAPVDVKDKLKMSPKKGKKMQEHDIKDVVAKGSALLDDWRKLHLPNGMRNATGGHVIWHYQKSVKIIEDLEILESLLNYSFSKEMDAEILSALHLFASIHNVWHGYLEPYPEQQAAIKDMTHAAAIAKFERLFENLTKFE